MTLAKHRNWLFSIIILVGINPLQAASQIDVIIAYDSEHQSYWGHNGMLAQAHYVLAFTEGVFSNGSLDVEFNIVHCFFDENFDFPNDDPFDWFLISSLSGSTYQEYISAFGADLMIFFGRSSWLSYRGKALLPGAYCCADLVWYQNSETGYVVAHEVGHTFGGGHDNDDGGMDPYSHAYRWSFEGEEYWTTIADGTYGLSGRIPYFSNPNLSYDGHPIGIPAFLPPNFDPNPNGADNNLTIGNHVSSAEARQSQNNYLWRDSTVLPEGYHYLSWFGTFDLSNWHEIHIVSFSPFQFGRYLYHEFLEWCWIDSSTLLTNNIWMWSHKYNSWIYTQDSWTNTAWVDDGSTDWIYW